IYAELQIGDGTKKWPNGSDTLPQTMQTIYDRQRETWLMVRDMQMQLEAVLTDRGNSEFVTVTNPAPYSGAGDHRGQRATHEERAHPCRSHLLPDRHRRLLSGPGGRPGAAGPGRHRPALVGGRRWLRGRSELRPELARGDG